MMELDLSPSGIQARGALLEEQLQYASWSPDGKFLTAEAGREHYRLLSHLAHQLPEGAVMADVGTYRGWSALALATDPTKTVVTWDVEDCVPRDDALTINNVANIERRIKNCFEDMADVLRAPLICLDIDPHDGAQERRFFAELTQRAYKGIVVVDDIHLGAGMQDFWRSIQGPAKYDVTPLGHWSGTGLVIFGDAIAVAPGAPVARVL